MAETYGHFIRVRDATCLYQVLAVNKSDNVATIKKSYLKLAKLLHPDKCTQEGSTAVFQKAASSCESHVVVIEMTKTDEIEHDLETMGWHVPTSLLSIRRQ